MMMESSRIAEFEILIRRFVRAMLLGFGVLPHFAGAVTDPTQLPAGLAQASSEHAKLLRLLESCQAIEITLNASIQHLITDFGTVETTTLYQDLDLSTADGIRRARQRLIAFNAKSDGFADAQEQHWVDIETLVMQNSLDEPRVTDLRAGFAADRAESFPNYRAWFRASRDDAAAVSLLLDVAQNHLGHTTWRNGRLNSADQRADAELQRAESAVANAEHRYNDVGRLALRSRDKTCGFIKSALQLLEKGRPRAGS
jgi:hypothetical protein